MVIVEPRVIGITNENPRGRTMVDTPLVLPIYKWKYHVGNREVIRITRRPTMTDPILCVYLCLCIFYHPPLVILNFGTKFLKVGETVTSLNFINTLLFYKGPILTFCETIS